MGGLRGRLTFAIVGLVVLTVVGIGVGTYAFVGSRLRDGLLADASHQVQFNLSVLVPDRLPEGAGIDAYRTSGLPEAFRLRGDEETIVDFGSAGIYVSNDALAGELAHLPAAVRATAGAGRLAFAWTPVAARDSLVVAGRQGSGPVFYFVFPTASIDQALEQLRAGLLVGGLAAIALALVASSWIARRILVPVRTASQAAAMVAGGDLTVRVPEAGSDELAAWAAEFNRMAAALEATIHRLEAAQQQNRRFVADVTHELRTPLAALVAESSVIEAGLAGLPPDARRAGELLIGDVRRLRTLVEDLLELSRFDAAAEQPTLMPLDLGRSVESILRARLPTATLVLPDEPIVVLAELRRLDRIVGNLLDNARTHAPGARVEVTVRREGPDHVQVLVADRGPGVASSVLPQLFDRFYKADPSRGAAGTGLGLAIASEHASLLGGEIRAANRDDGGLVVTLTLPATGSLPTDVDPSAAAADARSDRGASTSR